VDSDWVATEAVAAVLTVMTSAEVMMSAWGAATTLTAAVAV